MITVEVDGRHITFVPKSLQNFVEKIDYIKSRRPSPYTALEGIPVSMPADKKNKMAEMAMSAFMKMSSVSFEEEIAFDCSLEGHYHTIWQGAKNSIPAWQSLNAADGVSAARVWFDALTTEKAAEVRMAIRGIDQRALAKNSDGLPES